MVEVKEVDVPGLFGRGCVYEKFVFDEDTILSAARGEVFEFEKALEVSSDLSVAPASDFTKVFAGEVSKFLFEGDLIHFGGDEGFDVS